MACISARQTYSEIVENQAASASAIAEGNNLNNNQLNAIAHAYSSAQWTYNTFNGVAKLIGDIKEAIGSQSIPGDEARDQFNNEVGRRIGDHMKENGLSMDALDDLIMDALKSNQLVDSLNDPRLTNNQDPAWNEPTSNWQGSSAGRYPVLYPDPQIIDNLFDCVKDELSEAGESINNAISTMAQALAQAILGSPIVLDLDNDNIEYIANTATGGVFFDIDADGFAEKTEWIKPDDGFLVRDLNSNGVIDSQAELFGDNGGTTAYAKLAKLATLNTNNTGASANAFTSANDNYPSLTFCLTKAA